MKSTRREFLASAGAAAGAAAFMIVPRHVLGGPGHVPPSETVRVALVGVGGRAQQNMRGLMNEADCRIVAVADPVEEMDLSQFYYKGVAGRGPTVAAIEKHYGEKSPGFKCAAYEDFRDLYEKGDFDAILSSTADHAHATVSIPAMRAGKHVYCEKPLVHNIREARLMDSVAAETGVATQMGNQGHSNEGIRKTVEWIRAGAIGPVHEVHAWAGSSRWNKTLAGPPESAPVPSGVNWNVWLGPRDDRPYSPAYHPVAWRDFWDFGAGTLGDFGCHDLDGAFWALDLATPRRIEAHPAGYTDHQIVPHGEIVYYDFDARGDLPPLKLTWYGGGLQPQTPPGWPADRPFPGRGTLFVGERGMLYEGGAGGEPILLGDLDKSFERPEPTLPRSKGHYRDWLDAVKGGEPASSNFGYGAKLTELVLLGIASLRLGKPIEWDAANMKAKGLPEADAIFHGSYRPGWELT